MNFVRPRCDLLASRLHLIVANSPYVFSFISPSNFEGKYLNILTMVKSVECDAILCNDSCVKMANHHPPQWRQAVCMRTALDSSAGLASTFHRCATTSTTTTKFVCKFLPDARTQFETTYSKMMMDSLDDAVPCRVAGAIHIHRIEKGHEEHSKVNLFISNAGALVLRTTGEKKNNIE